MMPRRETALAMMLPVATQLPTSRSSVTRSSFSPPATSNLPHPLPPPTHNRKRRLS